MNHRRLATVFALGLLVSASRRLDADEAVLRDDWQVVHMGGARVGWEHTSVKRLAGSPERFSTTTQSRMVMLAMGAKRDIAGLETTVEAADGTLVSIHAVDKQSAEETTTDIAFEGRKARVTTTAMGTKRETTIDVPEGVIGPWRATALPREAGYPVGKSFAFKSFQRQLGGVVGASTTVEAHEELELAPGTKVAAVRLRQTIEGVPMKVLTWVDKDGAPVQTRVEVAGMVIETRRATKEAALAERDEKVALPDMFTKSLILVETLFPHARTADGARIRLRPRREGLTLPDLSDAGQTVEAPGQDGSIVIAIKRRVPPAGRTGVRPLKDPPSDVAPFLVASSSIQSDDPLLQEKAKEAVGEGTDAWKAAQAVERWVWKNLTKKSMGVGFASALEVCKNREGDCTEHSVLVAGLCRAAGIPSRVVMGLECIQGIWGGHAWNEVWIDGAWYPLDATLGYGSVDPLHLAIAKTALAEASFGQELMGLLSILGEVNVDVLEVTWNGRTFRPSDPGEVRVRYDNRLFDLSFLAPPGYELEPIRSSGMKSRLAEAKGKAADGSSARISVGTLDAPADFELPAAGTQLQVDGRPAILEDKDGRRRALVLREDTLFAFEMKPATTDADRKTFADFLATVDLDPVAPEAVAAPQR